MSYQCAKCERKFQYETSLHAHCRDKEDHPYCVLCERLFSHMGGLIQHINTSSAHTGSDYDFDSASSSSESEEEAFCQSCNRSFVDIQSLSSHLAYSAVHNWCFECSRDFGTVAALLQHNRSPVHLVPTQKCPFCFEMHKVPSATAQHIESGCHKITRHQVTKAIHTMGIIPTISIANRLENASNSVILETTASKSSFNGRFYECFLCEREFKLLESLNQHLNSAAHDADEFKCPKCQRQYTLISGLIHHIESEACGVAKLSQVSNFADSLTSQFSRMLKL